MKPNQKQLLEFIIRKEVKKAVRQQMAEASLYSTFVEPFKDIFDTAKAGVGKTAQTVASTIGSLAKQSFMALLPYVPGLTDADSMARVGEKHKENLKNKLSAIDSKYAEVFDRNWKAIAESDIAPLLFLTNPQLALGTGLLVKGSEVTRDQAINALSIVDSLVGGSKYIQSAMGKLQQAAPLSGYTKAKGGTSGGGSTSSGGGGYDSGYDGYDGYDGFFTEQNIAQPKALKKPDYRKYVEDILKNPQIQAAIKQSPAVAAMQQTAVDAIVDNTKELLNFSFEDIKKKAGPNFQKIVDQLSKTPGFENKNLATDKQMQDMVVANLKKTVKDKAIQQLNTLTSQNASLGPAVKLAIAQIQKI
jgi:hypothetical protein